MFDFTIARAVWDRPYLRQLPLLLVTALLLRHHRRHASA